MWPYFVTVAAIKGVVMIVGAVANLIPDQESPESDRNSNGARIGTWEQKPDQAATSGAPKTSQHSPDKKSGTQEVRTRAEKELLLQAYIVELAKQVQECKQQLSQDAGTIHELNAMVIPLERELRQLRAQRDLDQKTILQLQALVDQLQSIRLTFPPAQPDNGTEPHA